MGKEAADLGGCLCLEPDLGEAQDRALRFLWDVLLDWTCHHRRRLGLQVPFRMGVRFGSHLAGFGEPYRMPGTLPGLDKQSQVSSLQ